MKRLSAGKPEQLRLDDFVLYLDENLDNCKPIIEALEQQNIRYERHHAYYARGTDDDVWLPFVGERGWIVLTKDKRNRYNEWEKLAVQTFSIREFYFGSGNFTGAEMAESLKLALPELKRAYHSHEPPLVVSITRSGSITVVFDKHGSTHERRKAAKVRTKPAD